MIPQRIPESLSQKPGRNSSDALPKQRRCRWSPTILMVALPLLFPIAAIAQSGSPFDTGFTALQLLFTGTVARVASLIAIVIGSIPASTKALWPLAMRFAPVMLAKKPIVLQTEGLSKKPFHGRVVMLVNRHTASAAEMIVAFARENHLATIIGE